MTSGNGDYLRHLFGQWGRWAWVMFALLGTPLVSIGFPRILLAGIAGAMFGSLEGTLLAQIVVTVAAAPPFLYTHFLGRDLFVRKMGRRVRQFDQLLKTDGFATILLVRLCPVGNAFVTNCLAGVTSVPFWTYFAASFLGFLPLTFICALLGATLGSAATAHASLRLGISIGLFVVFSLFFLWYVKHSKLAREVVRILRDKP
jgi:uncharacterized membrane protein YdjX (TVP38/TMEM64 family)